jgi:hypothetical protein
LSGSFHPLNDEQWDHSHFDGSILSSLRLTNIIANSSSLNEDKQNENKKRLPKWWNDSHAMTLHTEIEQTRGITHRSLQISRDHHAGTSTKGIAATSTPTSLKSRVLSLRKEIVKVRSSIASLEEQYKKTQSELQVDMTDLERQRGHSEAMVKQALEYSQTTLMNALASSTNNDATRSVPRAEIKRLAQRAQIAKLLKTSFPRAPTPLQWNAIVNTDEVYVSLKILDVCIFCMAHGPFVMDR